MSTRTVLAAMVLATVCGVPVASASPPNASAGKAESALCSACHGSEGMSVATNVPNLAGQHYEYLMEQLLAYKAGTRKNGVMNDIIRSMTVEQLRNIAAYFSSVPVTVASGKPGE